MAKQNNKDFTFTIGSRHPSNNYGWFTIIADLGMINSYKKFRIKFEDTGFETEAYATNIKKGEVKDPYAKTIFGIACMGDIKDQPAAYKRDYNRWSCMINRCYNPNHSRYPLYGALGITVCQRWLTFEYYYEDIKKLPNYAQYIQDPNNWQLDKDVLQQDKQKNEMVYSPETCMFIPRRLNILYASENNGTYGKYYGVRKHGAHWEAEIKHGGEYRIIGIYDTQELAAGAYNCFISYFYPYMPYNQVRTLTAQELVDLDWRSNQKTMCTIIEQPNMQPSIAAKELTPVQVLAPAMHRFYNQSVEMCRLINH